MWGIYLNRIAQEPNFNTKAPSRKVLQPHPSSPVGEVRIDKRGGVRPAGCRGGGPFLGAGEELGPLVTQVSLRRRPPQSADGRRGRGGASTRPRRRQGRARCGWRRWARSAAAAATAVYGRHG